MLTSPSLPNFRLDSNADLALSVIQPTADKGDFRRAAPPARKRKVLIVQGDWEAGMSLLALDLKDAGHEVGKVFFCVPDVIYKFRGIRTHLFRKPLEDFENWLRDLIQREDYDTFFLYNHYRPYNQVAWKMAAELDLGSYVFELGLIRPNCVTVFSRKALPLPTMAKAWEKLLAGGQAPKPVETPPELCQVSTSAKLVVFCTNFFLSRVTSPLFPNFVDQREMKLWSHFKHGVIHLWRFIERGRDCEFDPLFAGEMSGTYYAVPLQVHSDTQITMCSDFKSIEQFIKRVVNSFEHHAPADTKLVFKIHPMDRGYKDYTDLIAGLDHRLGGGRILYVDRVHLPTLLANSSGVVNINSSVGISGLVHHVPVITLGKAVYDLPELTFSSNLNDFWTLARKPKSHRVKQFINLLLATSQGRGTLSQRCFDVPGRCKIKWPEPFQQEFFSQQEALGDDWTEAVAGQGTGSGK
jgi:capsule polysaccharide modification protein KpsS